MPLRDLFVVCNATNDSKSVVIKSYGVEIVKIVCDDCLLRKFFIVFPNTNRYNKVKN